MLQNLVGVATRYVRQSGAPCPCPWSTVHGWSANIHKLLLRQGWASEAPWTWKHSVTGYSLCLLRAGLARPEQVRHEPREGFRAHAYTKWQHRSRNDSLLCVSIPYDCERCKQARILAQNCRAKASFMCGAFVSHAALSKGRGSGPGLCPFCSLEPGTTEHLLWRCTELAQDRPGVQPADQLQRRLGWPAPGPKSAQDEAILDWCTAVRQKMLSHRHKKSDV